MTAAGAAATPQPMAAVGPRQDQAHQAVPSDLALRVKSLESLLVDKGLVDPAALDALIDTYGAQGRPPQRRPRRRPRLGRPGATRSACSTTRRRRSPSSATPAARASTWSSSRTRPTVHNLIVCTLCSCYPWPVLGLPPVWYKSAPYRSRAVIDPRGVLRRVRHATCRRTCEVRVWDSTAELRYIVLPERPAGTEGMSEEALAALVTRDAMVGVARVAPPASGGRP